MTHRTSTRPILPLLAALPLLVTGCGGDSSTGNGFFGGTSQSAVSPSVTPSVSPLSGATTSSLTPNAAPAGTPGTGASGGAQTGAGSPSATTPAATPNGSLAPLSGTYAGTWTPAPTVAATATDKDTDAKSVPTTPAAGGAVTLKLSYPKHASKTSLGDVSGTWADPAMGGVGRITGTVDRIGIPSEPNAVHLVGKVTFPNGKSHPLTLQLAEDAVGHLGGTVTGETISLKKTR